MWLSFFAAWVAASIILYAYLVVTAREPRHWQCMDCRKTDCTGCKTISNTAEADYLKKAA